MKKILVLLFVITASLKGFSQFNPPPYTSQGATNTITQNRGAFWPVQSLIVPTVDTLNNPAVYYAGALTRRPQDSLLYMSNGIRWLPFVSTNTGLITDSIYVKFPLGVYTDATGHQVIYTRLNGLINGGVVSKTGCLTLSVSPAIYNLNYLSYVSPLTALTIDSGNVSFGRYDEVIADSFGLVSILKGTPSATPSAVQLNPSSQILLTTIFIPSGATCLNAIYTSTIYDQNFNTEYTVTKSGTITEDTANLNNPYHLTKGLFVSTYTDGSKLIFTKPSGVDTVFSSSVFILPTYFNNAFTNQFQLQLFHDDTAISQNVVINPFLNPLDSNEYQVVSIPFQYLNTSGTYFNKAIITHAGYDTSGTQGYYFDWIRVQHGITNTTTIRYVDSTKIIAGNEYYYVGGIAYLAGAVSGSGGTPAGNYGDIQLNRNGAFATPSSDSLAFGSGTLNVTGGIISTGNITAYNSAGTKSISLNAGNPTINMNGTSSTLHLNINNITSVKDLEFPNVSGNLGESVTINGVTTHAGTDGNINVGTISGGLTFDSTITSTAGQTAFTFSTASIPSSTKTIFIEVNGIDWLPTTGYTRTSSTVITLTASDLVVGDKVRLRY